MPLCLNFIVCYFEYFKKLHACKPDSVLRISPEPSSFICDTARAAPVTLNPSASREPLSSADIRELSIRKVYPPANLHLRDVVSYTTFSPLSRLSRDGYFLRHYLFPGEGKPPVRWCGALYCPDFPFLFAKNDEAACSRSRK